MTEAPAEPAAAPGCDTRGMLAIHGVFRVEFAALPGRVRAARSPETATVVAEHVQLMLSLLLTHHEGEDRELWPLLIENDRLDRRLWERMAAEHQALHPLMDSAAAALPEYVAEPGTADELAAVLERLDTAVDEHLTHEEVEALPLIAEHLTQEQFDRIGVHSRAHSTPLELSLALGMMIADDPSGLADLVLAEIGPEGREAYESVGRPQYEAYRARLDAAVS